MKKQNKRKCNRYTRYTYFDELKASNTQPMQAHKVYYHLISVYEAIASINESGLTPERWFPLLYATKMMQTLVLHNIYEDNDNLINKALNALEIAANNDNFKSEEEFNYVKNIVSVYEDVFKIASERSIISCHRATEKRMQKEHGLVY